MSPYSFPSKQTQNTNIECTKVGQRKCRLLRLSDKLWDSRNTGVTSRSLTTALLASTGQCFPTVSLVWNTAIHIPWADWRVLMVCVMQTHAQIATICLPFCCTFSLSTKVADGLMILPATANNLPAFGAWRVLISDPGWKYVLLWLTTGIYPPLLSPSTLGRPSFESQLILNWLYFRNR